MGKVWAAPNIGIAKAELYDLYIIFPYLKTRVELVSYSLVES